MFHRTGLATLAAAGSAPVSGRSGAARPNETWAGGALHAIGVDGGKTCLSCLLDGHSRAVMAAGSGFAGDTIRLAAALVPALGTRGVPGHVCADDGPAFVDARLLRACARLGIKLVHSPAGTTPLNRPILRLIEGSRSDRMPGNLAGFFRAVRRVVLIGPGQCALLVSHDRC
jgi:putative transposase